MKIAELIQNIKQDSFWQIATASLLALVFVYASELIAHLRPCILCIYQRLPYFTLLVIALIGIILPAWRLLLRFLIVILFIAEIILAAYHVGIEHYIFDDNHVCQIHNQMSNLLSSAQIASSCSQVTFKFMNFSMAEWNLFYAAGLLFYFIYRERKNGFFTW